ncbi:tetratricopeptide repeat protein [Rubricoccus marinus]|uniref:Tetratricopeptide repeat protein n=1 Tax=Rubricoccus marinus TaxID=716817 RepID=A0A259U1X6_9BACT|nr:hypothetical protein [Rubricoccus marinus]OZC03814.1 hypothetical protein BSZ36_12950 [Rubricoccus marinus]
MRSLFVLLFLAVASGAAAQPEADARRLALSGDATAALDLLLGADDLSPEARRLAARLALERSRPLLAAQTLATADTSDADAQLLLGLALRALGDARGAETALRHAHRLRPGGEATADLAVLLESRRPDAALPLYRLLASQDTLNPVVLGALGRVYARLDSLPLAQEALGRAYALYPRGEAVAISLAETLEDDLDAQTAHLDTALTVLPRSSELWRLRGGAAMRAGETARAVNAYRSALVHDDSTAARLRDLGVALYYLGDVPEAFDVLRSSFERDSTDDTTLRVYGFAASENGQTALALRLLAKASDAMGREPLASLYERIGRIYSEDLQDSVALDNLSLAHALAPEDAAIAVNRAIILQQTGKRAEALAAYQAALAQIPEAQANFRELVESRIEMIELMDARFEEARQRRVRDALRRRLNE